MDGRREEAEIRKEDYGYKLEGRRRSRLGKRIPKECVVDITIGTSPRHVRRALSSISSIKRVKKMSSTSFAAIAA